MCQRGHNCTQHAVRLHSLRTSATRTSAIADLFHFAEGHAYSIALLVMPHTDVVPAQIMDEIQAGLRYMFQTESKYTCLVTGSGVRLIPLQWPYACTDA